MNSKLQAAILLVLFMLAGCSAPVATPTIQPSAQATNAPLLPTATITAIPSATSTPEADFPEGCINLNTTNYDPAALNGFLYVLGSFSEAHLLDPRTNQYLDVDKNGQSIFFPRLISPNKKYMLAEDDKYNYMLRTADQVIRTNLSIPVEWFFPRWLDNEHIAFLSTKAPKQDVIIFNPFTGEQQSIHLNLPNSYAVQINSFTTIFYYFIDPSLKRILYTGQSGRLILWDLETQKEMASLPSPAEIYLLPFAWSPDGTKYVTPWPEGSGEKPLANELYVFEMNGKLEELTNLNQKYAVADVELPTWSPDGRRIGFWLKIGSSDSNLLELRQWLAILDTQTLETTVYCLADKPRPSQAYHIVWSPDGQQLIVRFGSRLGGNLTPILVDLVHQTKAVINTQNMSVEDWMAP
jgi:WD40 repeat protein